MKRHDRKSHVHVSFHKYRNAHLKANNGRGIDQSATQRYRSKTRVFSKYPKTFAIVLSENHLKGKKKKTTL